jgi:hypothetical protein
VSGLLMQTRSDACTALLLAAYATGPRTLIPSAMEAIRAAWLREPESVKGPAVIAVMSWLAKHDQVPEAANLARETLIMDANYLPALSDVCCREFMHKHSLAHKKARTNISQETFTYTHTYLYINTHTHTHTETHTTTLIYKHSQHRS